eukprot:CAMPEP_0167828216 /NCGR_PEP_ID=MMETSP0112_2-20121227/11248_1 /TAXON_ID=91324 /ORGANISM="Lotharella globosa, Strain CCCM811" /LENGTH=78 /DNA_ID=CAMNT_0007731309 /DNA_START=597 /DNA_END=833 /DNA_ORIENTATION=+
MPSEASCVSRLVDCCVAEAKLRVHVGNVPVLATRWEPSIEHDRFSFVAVGFGLVLAFLSGNQTGHLQQDQIPNACRNI